MHKDEFKYLFFIHLDLNVQIIIILICSNTNTTPKSHRLFSAYVTGIKLWSHHCAQSDQLGECKCAGMHLRAFIVKRRNRKKPALPIFRKSWRICSSDRHHFWIQKPLAVSIFYIQASVVMNENVFKVDFVWFSS